MLKSLYSSVAIAALLALPAQAEESLKEVIVTVTRAPTPLIKTGQSVSVLDEATIVEKQTLSVADLLVTTPSLAVAQSGGLGTSATARIRGAESDQTLYILDGIRLSDPSQVGGGSNLGLITTGDLSRIEVVRGPLSTLWGSRALGGVVNLSSKAPSKALEADVAIEGLEAYGAARAGIGGTTGGLSWRVFAARLKDDDVSAYKFGEETDSFSQNTLRLSLDYRFNDAHALKFRALNRRSHNDYDGYPAPDYMFGDTDDYGNTTEGVYGLGYEFTGYGGAFTSTLSLSQAKTERHDYDGTDFETVAATGTVDTLDYSGTMRLSDTTRLVFGASHERSEMDYSSYGGPVLSKAATINSVFVQGTHDFSDAFNVTGSVRFDDHDAYGGQTIAHLSARYALTPALNLRGSVGQGFKAPSLYQLYSEYGNTELEPEKAVSTEVGLDYYFQSRNARASVTIFGRETENQIDFASCFGSSHPLCPTRPFGYYDNIAETTGRGIELEFSGELTQSAQIRAQYSHVVSENALTDADLPRRPRHMASVEVTQKVGPDLTLGLGVRHASEAFDSAFATEPMAAYSLIEARASYRISNTVTVYGRVENLSDEDYETVAGYGTPGRRLWLGLRADLF